MKPILKILATITLVAATVLANGGINVAWAYKMNPDEVRKYAPQKFMDCCVEFLNLAIDDPSAANDFVQMAYDLFS